MDDESVGLTHKERHEIHIESTMPEHAIKATLFHEVFHAIAWVYGFNPPTKNPYDMEEAIVCLFSNPLLTVLLENDTLRRYLLDID